MTDHWKPEEVKKIPYIISLINTVFIAGLLFYIVSDFRCPCVCVHNKCKKKKISDVMDSKSSVIDVLHWIGASDLFTQHLFTSAHIQSSQK